MEAREMWLLFSFLIVALGASISLVASAVYIPLKKVPNALKTLSGPFYQKLYLALVLCLFSTLIGLGIYFPLVFDRIQDKDTNEIVRTALFVIYAVSLLLVTLSFKKQTLSSPKMAVHAFCASAILVIATQENTLDFFKYPYILLVLALFAIVRYGVKSFNKKL